MSQAKKRKIESQQTLLTGFYTSKGNDCDDQYSSHSDHVESPHQEMSQANSDLEYHDGIEDNQLGDDNGGPLEDNQLEEQHILQQPASSSSENTCPSLCCSATRSSLDKSQSDISQPTDVVLLNKTKVIQSGKSRCFLPSWYKQFPWIHFCRIKLKVFCFHCMVSAKNNTLTIGISNGKADSAFISSGFSNWKKAVEKFKDHEKSSTHRNVLLTLSASRNVPINEHLQKEIEDTRKIRRQGLIRQVAALRYLLRQGISIRNDHEGGSNLTIMLSQVLEESSWVKENKYQSPECVNEMIQIMGHSVLRTLVNEITAQRWFSLLADETRDITNREQMVVCLRYVSDDYEVFEDLLGLVVLENTTSDTIYMSLKDCIIRLGLSFENCRGQGYDGASNFQGHVTGVAKRFQSDYPAALPVHCLAHCVNLCLQDLTRNCNSLKQALNFAMEAIQLIKYSPKRQVIFEKIQKQQDGNTTKIRTLCPTRWTVRTGAMRAIASNYKTLQETMEEASHGTSDCARRANGVYALMDKFSTYYGLKLSILLFSITEQLSTTLQGKQMNVDDSFHAVDVCVRALERLRTDDEFTRFFSQVKNEASDLCEEPVLPRTRRPPKRIDDGAAQHTFPSITEYFRREYYEAIDLIKGELERRFSQPNFLVVRKLEKMLLDSANGGSNSIPDEVQRLYCEDIDMDKLKIQLQMIQSAVQATPLNGISIKRVTRVQTLCDIFNHQPSFKKLFTEVDKTLRIYLTIPVTTATAERNFSSLRRIKTYLRNSMTQCRLNNCMLLHVLKNRTDQLCNVEIAREFVYRNERRINYFGSFV